MNAPDVNLLLYAYDSASVFHRPARDYLAGAFSSPDPFGIPVQCLHGFLRIITNPAISPSRMPMHEAIHIVEEWLALPQVRLLCPAERHWHILQGLIEQSRAVGTFVSDAAIAATVIEHGATLQTNDHGFARFTGRRWDNPLKPKRVRS